MFINLQYTIDDDEYSEVDAVLFMLYFYDCNYFGKIKNNNMSVLLHYLILNVRLCSSDVY